MEDDITVRCGTPNDLEELVRLKEGWAQLPHSISDAEREGFADDLSTWMRLQGQGLICRVAETEGQLVGMAWLVLFERVPDVHNRHRLTGDIQSVFVRPERRRQGIGGALVRSLLDAADRRGVPRVTVSANSAAVAMYATAGFAASEHLLERQSEPAQ